MHRLSFCRNSENPARFKARTTRSPETLGSLGMSMRDFDGRPERRVFGWPFFREAPCFEVKLDGFAEVGTSALNILPWEVTFSSGHRATYQPSSFVMSAEKR